jgi:hypothetical protein
VEAGEGRHLKARDLVLGDSQKLHEKSRLRALPNLLHPLEEVKKAHDSSLVCHTWSLFSRMDSVPQQDKQC